ncbi:hypothetical protein BDN70DRAFT_818869 [Pholiota conissans]|uniref:Uncharacterized protein n=1 Tax=Pholiota conissans TaxID=109636 RepID=A0A9P5YNP3_9AGAR|nr:hypothetical protein BDN70DRAFT_818869 [Pholiota conissans]
MHKRVRSALIKTGGGDIRGWHERLPFVIWAERITTRRSTKMSPFYAAHGVEPLLPFDITHATFLLPIITGKLSDVELLAMRARQLERREADIEEIAERVQKARFASIADFEKKHAATIVDYDFKPGELVLLLNKRIEAEVGRKGKPRYLGPMIVVRRATGGSYRLAELNGALSNLKYAAFRLIPYYPRCRRTIEITKIVDTADLESIED